MKTTNVTLNVNFNEEIYSVNFKTGNDVNEIIKESLTEQIEESNNEDLNELLENTEEFDFEVENWGDVEDYDNLKDLDTLQEIAETRGVSYDWEIISAALDCGIAISDIDDTYSGEFPSDEDFAESMADSLGYVSNNKWPFYCIDWEKAAKELMYDYCESNNHYFRNI